MTSTRKLLRIALPVLSVAAHSTSVLPTLKVDPDGGVHTTVTELQRLFLIEAVRYNVLPLDDRRFERFNPDLAGRPQLIRGDSQMLYAGMGRLSEKLGHQR